jgi:hypothetical protein
VGREKQGNIVEKVREPRHDSAEYIGDGEKDGSRCGNCHEGFEI